jgi:Fic family protein
MHYKWITDLDADNEALQSGELQGIMNFWKTQKEHLRRNERTNKFNQELARSWAIETGIIENVYSIDRGTTQLLIEKGFSEEWIEHGTADRPAHEIKQILDDHKSALEGIFDFIKADRPLSLSYIKELHAVLLRHQKTSSAKDPGGREVKIPLISGDWKKTPNNPTRQDGALHEYCPPEHVQSEMEKLLKWHSQHAQANISAEIQAAWIHHRFTQIHPFQDGNGRVARALATLVFLKADLFPLVIDRNIRDKYIDACERADEGDLKNLIDIFVGKQRDAFLKVISITDKIEREARYQNEIIDAIAERLMKRDANEKERELKKTYSLVLQLKKETVGYLTEIRKKLSEKLQDAAAPIFKVLESNTENSHWYKWQIVEMGKRDDYYVNTSALAEWAALKIKEKRSAGIIVSIHGMGYEYQGVVGVQAFIEYREPGEDGDSKRVDKLADVFSFAPYEPDKSIFERYRKWLHEAVLAGLDAWKTSIEA